MSEEKITSEINDSENNILNDSYVDDAIKEICNIICKADDEQFTYEFFKCLFTAPERKDFANRWLLVKEIEKGTTQREIAKKFGMSLCKITRGSKELSKPESAFRKALELLKNK